MNVTEHTVTKGIIAVLAGIADIIEAGFLFVIGLIAVSLASFYAFVIGVAWTQALTTLQTVPHYFALISLTVAVAGMFYAGGWFFYELRNTGLAYRFA